MAWLAEWGPKEGSLRAVADQTGEIPQALLSKPELPFHLQGVVDSFLRLHRTRQQGISGLQPIQMQEILAYCQLYGILDREGFADLILAADRKYRAVVGALKEKKAPDPK